jgi:D-3-phosphoglycerate dehydrogenase
MLKLAILDDYLHSALQISDWSRLQGRCSIQVFDRNLGLPDEAAEALAPFDILCLMRERMALPRTLLERLPNLKFVAATGPHNRTIDFSCATERGIPVSHTGVVPGGVHATPELAWGLVLATARHIAFEDRKMRQGGWQNTLGMTLHGRTLGLLGLGRIGRRMAEYGRAFGMRVIAWSQNLTEEAAAAAGATRVEKDALFKQSDVLSIHLVLSGRSTGLVGARKLALMQPSAYLINTSRGPIVDEAALLAALQENRIAGAGLDVFDQEPMADDHPFRRLDNVVLTPHLGYWTSETVRGFYDDTVEAVAAFLDGKPIRLLNPEVRTR